MTIFRSSNSALSPFFLLKNIFVKLVKWDSNKTVHILQDSFLSSPQLLRTFLVIVTKENVASYFFPGGFFFLLLLSPAVFLTSCLLWFPSKEFQQFLNMDDPTFIRRFLYELLISSKIA